MKYLKIADEVVEISQNSYVTNIQFDGITQPALIELISKYGPADWSEFSILLNDLDKEYTGYELDTIAANKTGSLYEVHFLLRKSSGTEPDDDESVYAQAGRILLGEEMAQNE